MNRRHFLSIAGAACALPSRGAQGSNHVLDPGGLTPFVDALPVPPVVRNRGYRHAEGRKVPYFRVELRELQAKLHRDLPPARAWGYERGFPGPTFETRSGQGLMVEWVNELPSRHLFPIDHTLHGAEASHPDVRAVAHVHGARTPPASDGYPESWLAPGQSAISFYPNDQDAAMLWYHDHAMAITRLNTYAGLFGAFFIRDSFEDALQLPAGPHEIPLLICDRLIRQDGSLYYPDSGVRDAPWTPEVFGNAFLVNGKLFPYLDVEPRLYRLRVLNASNARFLHLYFDGGPPFHQIGTDQGLLSAPVALERAQLAPGERGDLLVDFSSAAGQRLQLNHDRFVVMQFRVAKTASGAARAAIPDRLRPVPRTEEREAVRTRELAIVEQENLVGEPMRMLLNGKRWHDPVTENPALNTVEIWSLLNTTDDSHPIHLHLVRFQILDRRKFDVFEYSTTRNIRFTGPPVPPEDFEAGWKDTVRADPKMITRIIIRFEGYPGRYVWHCHVLEHEDNEMMRPYDVLPEPVS